MCAIYVQEREQSQNQALYYIILGCSTGTTEKRATQAPWERNIARVGGDKCDFMAICAHLPHTQMGVQYFRYYMANNAKDFYEDISVVTFKPSIKTQLSVIRRLSVNSLKPEVVIIDTCVVYITTFR